MLGTLVEANNSLLALHVCITGIILHTGVDVTAHPGLYMFQSGFCFGLFFWVIVILVSCKREKHSTSTFEFPEGFFLFLGGRHSKMMTKEKRKWELWILIVVMMTRSSFPL